MNILKYFCAPQKYFYLNLNTNIFKTITAQPFHILQVRFKLQIIEREKKRGEKNRTRRTTWLVAKAFDRAWHEGLIQK